MILRAQTRLARIYVLSKNFDEAEPLFHVLTHIDHNKLTVNPELMIDLDDLSDAYRQLQSNAQYGYEGLKRCVALRKFINPDHPRLREAYDDLSQYCKQRGNTKEAIEWILKAIAQDKTFPLNKQGVLVGDQLLLAEVYLKTDALDKAQQVIQEGMSVQSRCKCGAGFLPQLHLHLARIYIRRGQGDQAGKELQLAEKTIPRECEIRKELTDAILRYRRENDMMRRRTQGRSQ
jgi:tetratricopeptide (TPR) repeat protein